MTEERTGEEGRDDPELQNEYNLTFLKCSSTYWFMNNCLKKGIEILHGQPNLLKSRKKTVNKKR
jgi:hypothetical protein